MYKPFKDKHESHKGMIINAFLRIRNKNSA